MNCFMKRLFIYPAISVVAVVCSAADFPDTDFLWKSFRKTDYNEIHVNRVFVKPIPELQGKRSAKEKKSNQNTRARYKARCDLRNRVLNRIFSDFTRMYSIVTFTTRYRLRPA